MYKLKVNSSHDFDITEEELSKLDAIKTGQKQFHILHDNASVKAQILKSDFNNKSYSVKVNNSTYDVEIMNHLDQLVADMGFALNRNKKVDDIKAPMPGLILEINVKKGQEVKEDDPLLILEAMKMENVITSPREGIIKSIKVKQADTVDKNALLIEFE